MFTANDLSIAWLLERQERAWRGKNEQMVWDCGVALCWLERQAPPAGVSACAVDQAIARIVEDQRECDACDEYDRQELADQEDA